jgi:hypothetical protein
MSKTRGSVAGTRREFLKASAVGAASLAAAPAASEVDRDAAAAAAPMAASQGRGFFSDAELSVLALLAERILPGAGASGAIDYIEGLLTAFEVDPPRIHAGMLGQGEPFLPLDRIQEHAWRLRLYGSDEVEYRNESVLGPVRGLRPSMREGAREAARLAGEGSSPGSIWGALSDEFTDAFTGLVLEGSLGDPIYGGNRGGEVWRAYGFQAPMLAYGNAPSSGAAASEAAREPLHWTTRLMLWAIGFFSRRIA